jgi:hypothetical protein
MNPFMYGFFDELEKKAKYKAMPLSPDERAAAKKRYAVAEKSFATSGDGASPGKTKGGYDFHTHRSWTGSFPSFDKIPLSKIKFVASTA